MSKVFKETPVLQMALSRYKQKKRRVLTRSRGDTQSIHRFETSDGQSVLIRANPDGTRLTWSKNSRGQIKNLKSDQYYIAGIDASGELRTWLIPMKELYDFIVERWKQYEKENGRSYEFVAFQLLPPSKALRTNSAAMYIADWVSQYELKGGKPSAKKTKET